MSYWLKDAKFDYDDQDYFYLYRHMAFKDYYLDAILKNNLYFSSPLNFNDPFDCFFKLKEIPNREFMDEILNRLEIEASPAKKILHRKKLMDFFLRKDFLKGFFEEHFKNIGVICLNHNPLEILMWSHYAEYHQGFMIELKFPKDKKDFSKIKFPPHPVEYGNSYPEGNISHASIKDMIQMLCYKYSSWSYEKEYRLISSGFNAIDDRKRIYEYPAEHLTSVILGCNCNNSENINKLKEAISFFNQKNNKNIELFYAKKLESKFGITVPKHPRLDIFKDR